MPKPYALIAILFTLLLTIRVSEHVEARAVQVFEQQIQIPLNPLEDQEGLEQLKKGKKGKKPKLPPGCDPTIISHHMPKGFEPSDSVFANDTLFVVSDDSRLLAMDKNGDNVRVVTIGSGKREWDLEALTFVPGRPFLYIGVEEPQLILEFDVRKLEVTREWDISHSFKELPENAGMEALAYIKTNRSTTGGYFYAGCQHDARIFVFNINLDAAGVHPPELVAVIHDHPGPDFDFSAASVRKHQLYLLFDKAKTLIHLDLNSHEKLLIPRTKGLDDPSKLPFDISAKNATHEHYVFPTRGQEGFSISDEYAFLSVDSPTVKEIHRYSIEQMQRCFKTHGSGLFDEGED